MTSVTKNIYIDKLGNIVNEYNNTYHSTIKIKPFDVKSNTYIDSSKEIYNKNPKFKIGDTVRISKYKTFFENVTLQFVQKKFLWLKKLKIMYRGHEIVGTFYQKELQKIIKKEFRIEKVIKRKGDKLFVKWKGYDSSFNSWIDKKDVV